MSTLEIFLGLEPTNTELKICRLCGIEKNITDFPIKWGDTWRDTRCCDCKNRYLTELKEVKARVLVREMPENCECCGRERDDWNNKKLSFDHHYDSEGKAYFRGWICRQCNSGIGYLGDNLEGVKKAVRYLLRNLPKNERRKLTKRKK